MSHNVGGILVKVRPRLTVSRVRRAIESVWSARGATPSAAPARRSKPLSLSESRKLSFALLRAGEWIVVSDSERYNADFALASELAKSLETQVVWFTLYGATDAGVVRILGPGRKPKAPEDTYGDVESFVMNRLGAPLVYFDKLKEGDADDKFSLSDVEPTAYDRGPIPADEDEDEDAALPSERGAVEGSGLGSRIGPQPSAIAPQALPIAIPSALSDGALEFGLLIAFFLPGAFRTHANAVLSLFERWLASTPKEALATALVGASSTTVKPVNAQTLGRCRALLTAKAADKSVYFRIGGAGHRFEVHAAPFDAFAKKNGNACSVNIHMPWASLDQAQALAMEAAKLLHFHSGLVTPALFLRHEAAKRHAALLAATHPGLEIGVDAWGLGEHCHGAHWLTFLGPSLTRALEKKHSGALAALEPIACGHGILVRASESPELGDVIEGVDVPGLRRVALALQPITAPPPPFLRAAGPRSTLSLEDGEGPDVADFERALGERWCARLLEDWSTLRALVLRLQALERAEEEALRVERSDGAVDVSTLKPLLVGLPYASPQLLESLLTVVRRLIECERTDDADAIVRAVTCERLLGNARYRERTKRLLEGPEAPKVVAWLFARARLDGVAAPILASVGASLIAACPSAAAGVIAGLPAEMREYDRQILLQPINNTLGYLHRDGKLDEAERLSDAIQPIAHHHPVICLWTATIYIARGRIDDAMGQIELAFRHGYKDKERIRRDPDFAPLLTNPRFAALG